MITPLTICSGADGLKTYNRKDNRHQQMPFTLKRYALTMFSSTIRTLTVGFGISPNQSHHRCESRAVTAGRELHPAPKKIGANIFYI